MLAFLGCEGISAVFSVGNEDIFDTFFHSGVGLPLRALKIGHGDTRQALASPALALRA